MSEKIDWMLDELAADGFDMTGDHVQRVLDGQTDVYDPQIIDYILAMDKEWEEA